MLLRLVLLSALLSSCSFGVPIKRTTVNETSQTSITTPKTYKKPSSYIVHGKQYHVLDSADGFVERGVASWYGRKFHGRKTSSGDTYDMFAMTAAHKSLPLPTKVRVTNLSNGKSIIVKVNDRGPFIGDRIIDLSYAAAKKLDLIAHGTSLVEVRAITPNQSNVRVIPLASNTSEPMIYIQTGSFSAKANAITQQMQLKESNISDSNIYPIQTDNGLFYRVRIGPYQQLEQAQSTLQSLKKLAFDHARLVVENEQ